jgi:hypothetical protein
LTSTTRPGLDPAAIGEANGAADRDRLDRFLDEGPDRAQQRIGFEQRIRVDRAEKRRRATLMPALSASDLPPFSLSTTSRRGSLGLA